MKKVLAIMTADPDEPNKNITDDLRTIRAKLTGVTCPKEYSDAKMNSALTKMSIGHDLPPEETR